MENEIGSRKILRYDKDYVKGDAWSMYLLFCDCMCHEDKYNEDKYNNLR